MRLAFWRAAKSKAARQEPAVQRVVARHAMSGGTAAVAAASGDLDLRVLGQALARKRGWIIVPTVLAAVLSITVVNMVTPRYKSEARILVDGRENVFLRPNGERNEERTALDAEAVTSQVQLLLSRDLARDIIKKNKLAERPEFDPVLQGLSPVKSLLALFGIGRDPFSLTPEERVLDAYFDRFTAYAVDKSRVVVIEFQSLDPDLAARVANSIAEGYLVLQQSARQEQAKSAGQWLSGEIDNLRKKVGEAESRVEDFRSKSSLFVGTNNTTLSNQQMGELNTQLNNARALKSDAESKARLIREMLQSGKPIEASEVLNSELTRRLSEQRVTLRAQLAEQSSTLLDSHPRIKELKAQLADLDRQLREEASKISRSLDNDSRIAGGRVDGLGASLEQLKKQATSSNDQDVELRALEREAKSQRDLLESYLAKYREATSRDTLNSTPADARVISRATVSNVPAYPKKLPTILIASLAMLVLSSGLIMTKEILAAPIGFVSPRADQPALAADVPTARIADIVNERRQNEPRVAASIPISSIKDIAYNLRHAGFAAGRIAVFGVAQGTNRSQCAIRLARALAEDSSVILVGLASGDTAIRAISSEPSANGLAELARGRASLANIITKDRLSSLHLISAGHTPIDRVDILAAPGMVMRFEALARSYDHVVVDAGAVMGPEIDRIAESAPHAVLVAGTLASAATGAARERLLAAGFGEVTMLAAANGGLGDAAAAA